MLRLLPLLLLAVVIGAEQFVPETIFLPYSETEDVDFAIERPGRVGCFQWSCDNEEVIELAPVQNDYTLLCGSRLELRILPGTADPHGPTTLTIQAENVDMEHFEPATASVVFTVVVVPVARLEVMGAKTELAAGDPASTFGVAAFDKNGNELDTLDGVQLQWFVGAKRDVAKFHETAVGPIVNVTPLRSGKAQLICIIGDPNYSTMEPGILDIHITAPLLLEPDGAYLLPGGEAKLGLFERLGSKERPVFEQLPIGGEMAEHLITSREEEVALVDMERMVVVAGQEEDETSLLVKDTDGNIIKGVPVRVVRPHRMEVVSHPFPQSKQLIVNHEYDINITIYDADDHVIHPSDNILTKTTFGKQFDVIDISVNGLWARVKAVTVGIGKIKASLRSTLTPDDDETELVPHVKGVTEFEIFEEVLMSPRHTVLPWDSKTEAQYTLSYKVSGGGRVYSYSLQPDNLATVDSDGKVSVHKGPGKFTVTAGMSGSMHNNHTAQVLLLNPAELELPESLAEWITGAAIQVPVAIYGFDPDTKERVPYTDCADVPLEVTLTNSKDFSYVTKSARGDSNHGGGCVTLQLRGDNPGASTKVTVSFTTEKGKEVSQFRYVSAFQSLEVLQPTTKESGPNSLGLAVTVLPPGASRTLLFKGGPHPWVGKPSFFFSDVEVEDESIARATLLAGTPLPHHAAIVTCLKLGSTKVELGVGNKVSATNKKPGFQKRGVLVHCSAPAKISKVEVKGANQGPGSKEPKANPRTGRVTTYSYRDFKLVATVKDSEGRTLDNTTSLDLRFTLSDPSMAILGNVAESLSPTLVPGVSVPGKPSQLIHPNGKVGDLNIQVAVAGYRENVLTSVGAPSPPSLPSPPAPFGEEEEDEDYDYDDEGEPLLREGDGLSEEVELTLTTDGHIDLLYD